MSNAYIAELPPNTRPDAYPDFAEVSEDGEVAISVLANDTDADGDPIYIDSWNWQPANGTVTQETAGVLTYRPFPDFAGEDTFTYIATDGRDAASEMTVTVKVNAVNDAPRAFNDAYRYTHGILPYPYSEMVIPYLPELGGQSVFGNDVDVEGGALRVAALDTTGLVGQLSMTDGGQFTWYGPGSWFGETSFKYKADDYSGGVSDWATVKLWVLPSLPEPGGIGTADDVFPVGIEAQTLNVRYNDGGSGEFAVLTARPPVKRVTSFGFDGEFQYAPTALTNATFTYKVFGSGATVSHNTTVTLAKVKLEIFHGGFASSYPAGEPPAAAKVRENDKFTIGAVTVVNQNDTDGDGRRDHQDAWVDPASPPIQGQPAAVGVAEVDLMRLRVWRPAPGAFVGNVIVSVEHGSAKIYKRPDKKDAPVAGPGTSLSLGSEAFGTPTEEFDSLDYWVEIFAPSDDLRDITIRMRYGAASDLVSATGVWSVRTGFKTQGTLSGYNDGSDLRMLYAIYGNQLGLLTMKPADEAAILASKLRPERRSYWLERIHSRNMAEIEFTVSPADIYQYNPIVKFDVSRSVDSWMKIGDAQPFRMLPLPEPHLERPNDDATQDNDNNLFSWIALVTTGAGYHNKLYSIDGPGRDEFIFHLRESRYQYWLNAWEFVRVKIARGEFSPGLDGVLQGSRASEYALWHSWIDMYSVPLPGDPSGLNRMWVRGDAARNVIVQDQNEHPVFNFQ